MDDGCAQAAAGRALDGVMGDFAPCRLRAAQPLRRAFELVSEPLRQMDPTNAGLQQAHDLLSRAFPLDPRMPEDIALLTAQIDQAQLDA